MSNGLLFMMYSVENKVPVFDRNTAEQNRHEMQTVFNIHSQDADSMI